MGLCLMQLGVTAPGAVRGLFAPVDLCIAPGEVVCLTGPSGSGKSSLIAALGGHLPRGFAVTGRATLEGADLLGRPAEARDVGVMFQQAQLFAHLSVGDNLAFGLAEAVRGRAARRAAVAQALEQAGLAGFEGRDPATLSGGQRARAALMRALLAQPRALLLDEPFAALDPELRAGIRGFVLGHLRAGGIPALLVSHDAEDAAAADRAVPLQAAGGPDRGGPDRGGPDRAP